MCIITSEELEAERDYWIKVTRTNIFARLTRPGYQAIAYSLSIASKSAAAMILPLPVVAGSGEDALRFIDLSAYPDFFDDLAAACTPEFHSDPAVDFDSLEVGNAAVDTMLTVHEVGDFEASYVPTMADFTRLDPRFRLADDIWEKMPVYADYGFAVFQLKLTLSDDAGESENSVHPMAFEFPTRDPARLYFPTVHVHDGDFHAEAGFYHQRENARAEFKYQRDELEGLSPSPPEEISASGADPRLEWMSFTGYHWYFRSDDPAAAVMRVDAAAGLIDPAKTLHAMSLHGSYPNQDIWLGDTL